MSESDSNSQQGGMRHNTIKTALLEYHKYKVKEITFNLYLFTLVNMSRYVYHATNAMLSYFKAPTQMFRLTWSAFRLYQN